MSTYDATTMHDPVPYWISAARLLAGSIPKPNPKLELFFGMRVRFLVCTSLLFVLSLFDLLHFFVFIQLIAETVPVWIVRKFFHLANYRTQNSGYPNMDAQSPNDHPISVQAQSYLASTSSPRASTSAPTPLSPSSLMYSGVSNTPAPLTHGASPPNLNSFSTSPLLLRHPSTLSIRAVNSASSFATLCFSCAVPMRCSEYVISSRSRGGASSGVRGDIWGDLGGYRGGTVGGDGGGWEGWGDGAQGQTVGVVAFQGGAGGDRYEGCGSSFESVGRSL